MGFLFQDPFMEMDALFSIESLNKQYKVWQQIFKTPEGEAMDELGLIRYCCRKTMMTHIELVNEI